MKPDLQKFISLSIFLLAICFLPAFGEDETPTESYDNILATLDRTKETQIENQNREEEQTEENQRTDDEPGQVEISTDNYIFTFDHDRLPNLNGVWIVKRKTLKRIINPVLSKPITFKHCTTILPFEKRDFEEKQVVIAENGPNSFGVMALYPITDDVYYDPNLDNTFIYQNFLFKAEIRPEDLTYAYTPKLHEPIENAPRARQMWLNGKLQYEHISGSKIKARGWEVLYTPACHGYVVDEVEMEFDKDHNIKGPDEGIIAMSFLIEQAAQASPGEGAEPYDIPDEYKPMNLDSAKEKKPLEPIKKYSGKSNLVPGLW